jgi:hypothetical protein
MRDVRRGRAADYFELYACSDDQLEAGLADGTLAVDTRLRDALRTIRVADGTYRLPDPEPLLAFDAPDVADAAALAAEASVLASVDAVVRAEQRLEVLERRLASLHTLPRR